MAANVFGERDSDGDQRLALLTRKFPPGQCLNTSTDSRSSCRCQLRARELLSNSKRATSVRCPLSLLNWSFCRPTIDCTSGHDRHAQGIHLERQADLARPGNLLRLNHRSPTTSSSHATPSIRPLMYSTNAATRATPARRRGTYALNQFCCGG
jgi:hypothetical protein